MTTDDLGQRLHDRATRGERLSKTEQAKLDAWYVQQDREEQVGLEGYTRDTSVDTLQKQIDDTLAKITTVTQSIQKIDTENNALRREISQLRQKVARRAS